MMSSLLRRFLGAGQQVRLLASLVLAIGIAAWILVRHGRMQATASLALARAEAHLISLRTSKEIRNDLQNTDASDRKRRLARWMRD